MSFTKRQNEFSDIPGFDASKGERIAIAFQKLWAKIQYLEQNRTKETKSRSDASSSSKEEDLTLTDVQYKLLLLQLQYVRSLLKRNSKPNIESSLSKMNKHQQPSTLTKNGENFTSRDQFHLEIVNQPSSEEIHTDSLAAHLNSAKKSSKTAENTSENVQITSDRQCPRFRHSTKESTTVYQNTVASSSKPHYHLKLDDVPFILGASSAASHSVVANLQNIMARMKLHNKALCGPKPNATRSTSNTHSINVTEPHSAKENPKPNITRSNVPNLHSSDLTEMKFGENSQDATKMLNVLTRDLNALAAKQKRLVESIDATQTHIPEMNVIRKPQNHANNKNYKHVKNDGSTTLRSHSDSEVKLYAEVKKVPKIKEKVLVRSQPTNLTTMDRRKLLRSLQNFNRQLSEEDISWN